MDPSPSTNGPSDPKKIQNQIPPSKLIGTFKAKTGDVKKKVTKRAIPSPRLFPFPIPEGKRCDDTNEKVALLLEAITDENLNLLLSFFDAPTDGKRDKKIDLFLHYIYPLYCKVVPRMETSLQSFVEQIVFNNKSILAMKNPPLPICLQRSTEKPTIIRPVNYCLDGMDIDSPERVGKKEVVVIGTLFEPFNSVNKRIIIKLGGKDKDPCTFGEQKAQFYYIHQYKKASRKIHVSFPSDAYNNFSFFVVQYCNKRSFDLVGREIFRTSPTPLANNATVNNVFVTSKKCKCNSFNLLDLLNEISCTGVCICPCCKKPFYLNDLILDQRKKEIKEDKTHDIASGRVALSRSLLFLSRMKSDCDSWSDLFNDKEVDLGTDILDNWVNPFEEGTDAYLKNFDEFLND